MKAALWIFLFFPFIVNAQNITTYAGTGTFGYTGDGGIATNAAIGYLEGVRLDNNSNLIICTVGINDLVRKIDITTGIITTIAGSDTSSSAGQGGDGGPATCSFVTPYDVCFDAVDNFYIVDNWYSEIRKVTIATSIIDTFAGNRTPGNTGDGGPAKSAELGDPVSVCFDSVQRYLYISTEFGRKIRRVDMINDTIGTFAGTGVNGYSGDGGPAANAQFGLVWGICFDHLGNLYIADASNARIRKVDAGTGIVTTICGNGTTNYSGDGGSATNAMLNSPAYLCFDKCGNLYFSDQFNHRVRRIDGVTGIITTVAGNGIAGYNGDNIPATSAEINRPNGVCIDSMGNLYIGDQQNSRVRKVTIPLTVSTPTITVVSSTGDTLSIGAIDTFRSTATISSLLPYSYQWYLNGLLIPGSTNSTYIYSPVNGDSVSCIFKVITPCTGAITTHSNVIHMVVHPLTAPVTDFSAQSLSIYPNPVNDVLYIDNVFTDNMPQSYRLISIIGSVMQQGALKEKNNSISAEDLPSGMYILEVTNAIGQKIITKIAKQ